MYFRIRVHQQERLGFKRRVRIRSALQVRQNACGAFQNRRGPCGGSAGQRAGVRKGLFGRERHTHGGRNKQKPLCRQNLYSALAERKGKLRQLEAQRVPQQHRGQKNYTHRRLDSARNNKQKNNQPAAQKRRKGNSYACRFSHCRSSVLFRSGYADKRGACRRQNHKGRHLQKNRRGQSQLYSARMS